MKTKNIICPHCGCQIAITPPRKKNYDPQKSYYYRHRDKILAKIQEKRKDPEYRKLCSQRVLACYYRRKQAKA